MTDHALQALARNCKGLRHLELIWRENQYTDKGFTALASSCKKLEKLRIEWGHSDCRGSPTGDLILAALAGLPCLAHAELAGSGFFHITDEACIQFVQDTPTLCCFEPNIPRCDPLRPRNYYARANTYKALML